MCGFAGFLRNSTTSKKTGDPTLIIKAMTDCLTHRGPDDSGTWLNYEDDIALGHRRLAIIDLSSSGHQPMHSANGRYVIAFNGEIYNFIELRKQLQTKNYLFTGHSDTEVILALLTEYGLLQSLQLMSGMFAFAVWDQQEKTLALARDRIGEKPLYYGIINGSFVFGSELKALCAYPNFNNKLRRASLALFMQYGYIPAPHSIYENIYKLIPGHYIIISPATLNTPPWPKTYWSAVQVAQAGIAKPLRLSDLAAIQQTDNLLNKIIKRQMRTDVPFGALLSGGIDSSLITALMQANSKHAIKTFTIGFNEQIYNEAEYAKAIAKHLNTDHTEFYVDATQAIDLIPKLPKIYDEPFADSSAIPTFLVAQLTKQKVTVCLSGDGGDELFGGYNRYLLAKTIWKKMSLFPYPLRLAIKTLLLAVSPTRWQQILQFTQLPMVGDKLHKFAHAIAVKSPALLYQALISQWPNSNNILVADPYDACNSSPPQTILLQLTAMEFIAKMMLTDTISYLPDDLMVKVDRATMAVSLENRAPYLDHQLLEFLWQLPLHMKVRNRTTKWLLRQLLSQYVPDKLFTRPKMGFAIPLASWLRGPLRDWAHSLLNKKLIEQQGLLQAKPILEKWHEHLSGKRNWQAQLWAVLMFQAWMAQHRN